jgi:S1-C subfamily serine protease
MIYHNRRVEFFLEPRVRKARWQACHALPILFVIALIGNAALFTHNAAAQKNASQDPLATANKLADSILGVKLRVDGGNIIVSHIRRGGVADLSGVRPGDQLQSIEKHKIASVQDVTKVLQHYKMGDAMVLTVTPAAGPRQIYLAPPAQAASASRPGGAMLGANLSDDGGSVVTGQLSMGGPAIVAGLRSGDRIVSINGKPITSRAQLLSVINSDSPGDRIHLTVQRGEWQRPLVVTLGAKDQVAALSKMTVPPESAGPQPAQRQTTTKILDDPNDEWADENEALDIYNVNDRALYTDFD